MDTSTLPPWAVTALKWTAAIIALLLIVNFAAPRAWEEIRGAIILDTGADDDGLPEADAAATEPTSVEEGEVVAINDLATSNGTIASRSEPLIAVGGDGGDQILIGFPKVPADPACITEVTLEVHMVESSGAELVVRPAVLAEIAELEDGQALPPDAVIRGTSSGVAIATAGSAGWLRWDVLGPYTLAHRSAASDAPVVLSVARTEETPAEGFAAFATTDGPEELHARMSWAAVDPCSDLGRGEGVAEEDPSLREEAADAGAEDDGSDAQGDAEATEPEE